MRTASQVSSIADQLQTQAGRLVAQESLRADAIARVKENKRLSDFAKKEELAKVSGLEVLSALRAQVQILKADLDAAAKDWANLGQVLRAAALPAGRSCPSSAGASRVSCSGSSTPKSSALRPPPGGWCAPTAATGRSPAPPATSWPN